MSSSRAGIRVSNTIQAREASRVFRHVLARHSPVMSCQPPFSNASARAASDSGSRAPSEGKIVTAEIHRAKNSGDRRSVRNTAHRLSIGTGGSLSTNPLFVVSGRISRPPSDSGPSHASAGRVAPAFRNEVLAEAV